MKRTLIAAAAVTLLMTTGASAYGRGYHHGHARHYGHGHHGHGWGGFIAGAIVGGVIAGAYRPHGYYAPPVYAAPPPVYYVPQRRQIEAPLYIPVQPNGLPAYSPPCCAPNPCCAYRME